MIFARPHRLTARAKSLLLFTLAAAMSGGGSSSAQDAPTAAKGERLVPAAMSVITDGQGNSWNIEPNGSLGRVGNSMINSGLALLVNNQPFDAYQAMMTADGGEFVLSGRPNTALPGLQLLRRVKSLERDGALRFVDVVANTSTNALTVSIVLRTNFSGNYKTYLTEQGNSGVATLGPREGAILVTPGSNQANRAFLFTLADPKSPVKPIITSQNKYGLTFQYNLTIPAGQTVSLIHAVAQVPVPRSFERQTLARVFRPVAYERLAATVPGDLRSLAVNGAPEARFTAETLLGGPFLAHLGVERGPRDVLAMGERTRLIGQAAAAGNIGIDTAYGRAEIALDTVAAIVGGDHGRRGSSRIYLRDGQVFSGNLSGGDLTFAMAGGGKMNLQAASLDRLVLAKKAGADNQWAPDTLALVETHAGERLAIGGENPAPLRGMTPWGALTFTYDDIAWLGPAEDEPLGHFVEFKSGMRCFVFLSGESLPAPGALFGAGTRIETGQIRSIVTRAGLERARAAAPKAAANVILLPEILAAGGQRLSGKITTETLQVVTPGETVTIPPGDVRRLVNLAAEGGGDQFRLELWGGGEVTGYLAGADLALEVRGEPWRIPFADLREVTSPSPTLTEEMRQSIAKLVAELGHDAWQTREKASEDLKALGHLAQAPLRESLKTATDPEIRRRLERILVAID